MRITIVSLACAALLVGTAAASAHTERLMRRHHVAVVHHHALLTTGRGSRSDNPPGARFQNRGIRTGNEMRAIR